MLQGQPTSKETEANADCLAEVHVQLDTERYTVTTAGSKGSDKIYETMDWPSCLPVPTANKLYQSSSSSSLWLEKSSNVWCEMQQNDWC